MANIILPKPEQFIEEPEEDLISSLFNQAGSQQEEGEEITFDRPVLTPIEKIAMLLRSKEQKGYEGSTQGVEIPSKILLHHLPRSNRFSNSDIEAVVNETEPKDLAAILFAQEALKPHRISLPESRITNFSDYLSSISEAFSQRLTRFMSLEVKDEVLNPVTINQTLAKHTAPDITPDRYDFKFTDFNPNLYFAANTTHALLNGHVDRIDRGDMQRLSQRVFLEQTTEHLFPLDISRIRKAIDEEDNGLDEVVTRALIALTLKKSQKFRGLGVDEVLVRYQRGLMSRLGFSQDFAMQLSEMRDIAQDYNARVLQIGKLFEEQKGLVFETPRHLNYHDYEEFKERLLNATFTFFEPLPYEPRQKLERGDRVRTYKPVNKTEYADGRTIQELPIGIVGRIDGDLDFVWDGYYRLRPSEVQKLKEIKLPTLPITGKRAEIIDGGQYRITKNGSWGYVVGERGDKYDIRFEHVTGDTTTLPHTFDIWKKHVKITIPDNTQEQGEYEQKTLGVLKTLKEIITTVEAESIKKQEQRKELVRQGVETFKAMGINEGTIRAFFDIYLPNHREQMDRGLIPREDIFETINEEHRKIRMNYSDYAKAIVQSIQEDLGVVFPQKTRVIDAKSYEIFKSRVLDEVMQGFRIPSKKQTKRFAAGQGVMLLERYGDIKKGIVGVYIRPYGDADRDDHYVNLGRFGERKNIETTLLGLEKAFEIPQAQIIEMKKGAKVRIKKDSEFARQNDGVGVMTNNFGDQGDYAGMGWAEVRFENGYTNNYSPRDLEFAEPPVQLKGKALQEFQKATEAYEQKKGEIANQLARIIQQVEQGTIEREKTLTALITDQVDSLRTLGIDDKTIYGLFEKKMRDPEYLLTKKIIRK